MDISTNGETKGVMINNKVMWKPFRKNFHMRFPPTLALCTIILSVSCTVSPTPSQFWHNMSEEFCCKPSLRQHTHQGEKIQLAKLICGEPVISLHSYTVPLVQCTTRLLPVMRDPGSIPRGYLCKSGILLLALSRYNIALKPGQSVWFWSRIKMTKTPLIGECLIFRKLSTPTCSLLPLLLILK
jgi:hypothetical protein